MTEKGWAETLVSNVATEVKRIRKHKKISVRALAERTEQLGHPIGESVLSNFEYGRRGAKLDVAELLVLAAALEVPPALLLFPPYPDGHVQPLPDVITKAHDAVQWVSGRAHLQGHPDVKYVNVPVRVVALADERDKLMDGFADLLERSKDPKWIDLVFAEIERTNTRRNEIAQELRELGGVVDQAEDDGTR